MNSFYHFTNNIFYCDFINKFNFNRPNKILKLQKLIISTKLTTVNFKTLISKLLALEILTLKKSFINPHFYLTIKNGEYFLIKMELRKKNMELFILKYIWFISSKILKQKNILISQKQNKKNNLFFKFSFVNEFDYFMDLKLNKNNTLHLNLIFDDLDDSSIDDKIKINFYYKSLKLYF